MVPALSLPHTKQLQKGQCLLPKLAIGPPLPTADVLTALGAIRFPPFTPDNLILGIVDGKGSP